jgi:protein-L-isoaspartate(D-aspartate) O-methyltransferase
LVYGDGFKGLSVYAPFDRILVTCGAPEVPPELIAQLKPGGTLVVPVGAGEVQTMLVVEKRVDGSLLRSEHGRFRFVPMLESRTEGEGSI